MPIASIITPGTLSVQAIVLNQTSLLPVPFLNFTSLSFTDRLINSGDGATGYKAYDYNGPSQQVEAIAAAVSAQGVILAISPPALNSSWQLEFYGPFMKCETMNDGQRENVTRNIASFYAQVGPDDYDDPICTDDRALYLSWYQDLPFSNQSTDYNFSTASLHSDSGGNATISFATMPGMNDVNNPCADFPSSQSPNGTNNQNGSFVDPNLPIADQNPLGTVGEGADMLQCQFRNSTYNVNFEYVNGGQTIAIDAPVKSSDASFKTFNFVAQQTGPKTVYNETCQCNITSDVQTACLAFTSSPSSASFPDPCDFNPAIVQAIAYQGVIEAFTNILSGTVTVPYQGPLQKNTEILSTTLLSTNDLEFLNEQSGVVPEGFGNGDDLQNGLGSAGVNISGIATTGNSTKNQSLADALEEMFQNYTVSLMSSEFLR